MAKPPFILLVNPWVTDFAAYDLWAQPLGLLYLGALLKEGGAGVALIDCLDRHDSFTLSHPQVKPGMDRSFGTGKYPRMLIKRPPVLDSVKRSYYRYGIHPESFLARLQSVPRPDLVWVTSIMTYWYPGVQQAIRLIRQVHPGVPVWLGGIYARLCPGHAAAVCGADEVVTLPTGALPSLIEAATGFVPTNEAAWKSLDTMPSPAIELLSKPGYAPVLTSIGCPFRCSYCASPVLQPRWERRSAEAVHGEVMRWHERFGISDFAFYDDALLIDADTSLKTALERIAAEGAGIRFHTPNALHVRALTAEWCELLRRSGFTTVRLGLEAVQADRHRGWGSKLETRMFFAAVERLHAAGFGRSQIGVYLLCGLPDQRPEEVAESIRAVHDCGALPYLAEYSPIPGSRMWRNALAVSPFDIAAEPLFHNNTFFACRRPDFTCEDLAMLKRMCREARRTRPDAAGGCPIQSDSMGAPEAHMP